MKYKYDSIDARGEVNIRKGGFGPAVAVNGVELFTLDLFYLAEGGASLPRAPFTQIIISDPRNEDRNVALLRWHTNGTIEFIIQEDATNVDVKREDIS